MPIFRRTLVCAFGLLVAACGSESVSTLEFVEFVPPNPRLGEVTTARFRVLDYRGLPQAGVNVSFKLDSPNERVQLKSLGGMTEKGSGLVETQLTANAGVTAVIVVATAGTTTIRSPPIGFAGGSASGRQFTFQCGPISGEASGGIHAIGAYDPDRYLIAGVKMQCTAHVGDRSGDGVKGAVVTFLTEAGTIAPSETSISDVVGNATVLYKTSLPLPVPTDPGVFTWTPTFDSIHTGDFLVPLWMEPFRWTNNPIKDFAAVPNLQEPRRRDPLRTGLNLTLNPRDNLVSMIAVTSGEEGFSDINNDGVHNDMEPYEDLTEPFVDNNDDGTWNEGERYLDTNNDGKWNGKNETWDRSGIIWVQERILWTGVASDKDVLGATEPIFRIVDPIGPVFVPYLSYYGIDDPAFPGNRLPRAATILVTDPWYNSMAQNSESDGCELGGDLDKSPVNAVPKRVNSGFRFTYPPYTLIGFGIRDSRDPNTPLMNQVPKRNPPIDWSMPLQCTWTASLESGHKYVLNVGTLNGKVE